MDIYLNPGLSPQHKQTIVKYLMTPNLLTRAEWTTVYEAVDMLGISQVVLEGRTYTFAEFYKTFIDIVHAESFLMVLWNAEDVEAAGRQQQQAVIQAIRTQFQTAGWLDPETTDWRFLLMYCLYWWTSFAIGYTFEISVLKDLAYSGVKFKARDLRNRTERYAPADLIVGEFVGDVKSSTYFLFVSRSYPPRHDFYITRLWDMQARQYRWIVILTKAMWERINGDTVVIEFAHLLDVMPQPGRFDFAGNVLIAVDYQEWKWKIQHYQHARGKDL